MLRGYLLDATIFWGACFANRIAPPGVEVDEKEAQIDCLKIEAITKRGVLSAKTLASEQIIMQ